MPRNSLAAVMVIKKRILPGFFSRNKKEVIRPAKGQDWISKRPQISLDKMINSFRTVCSQKGGFLTDCFWKLFYDRITSKLHGSENE